MRSEVYPVTGAKRLGRKTAEDAKSAEKILLAVFANPAVFSFTVA
jgi:hypothetical protein